MTLMVPKDHPSAKGAACVNEHTAHVGFILYKFLGVQEEAAQPITPELILN